MKMNPDVKALWLEALRSGRFQQGRVFLCSIVDGAERYCAIGVLAQLAVEQGICQRRLVQTAIAPDHYCYGSGPEDDFASSLPRAVKRWCWLHGRWPAIVSPETGLLTGIDTLNDKGMSFNEIANLIEAHL